MKKLLQFLLILALGVVCCACVNTLAVHELNQKAYKLMEDGDTLSAISRLEASIDLDGEVYESRYNLGTAYVNVGRCQEAISQLEKATILKPKEPIAYYSLGAAGNCAAEQIYYSTNEQGVKIEKKLPDGITPKEARDKYLQNLQIGINAFENYLKLVPNAEDAEEVDKTIKLMIGKKDNDIKK